MGDGKKLKAILDSKGTNVRKIAKATGISATTLYSIIQKDSNIRFDFALRLANELEIDVNEICSASPFSGAITEEEIYLILKSIFYELGKKIHEITIKKDESYNVDFTLLYYENVNKKDDIKYICMPQNISEEDLIKYLFINISIYETYVNPDIL